MSNVDLTDMELMDAPARPPLIEIEEDAPNEPAANPFGYHTLLMRQIRRDGGTQARIGLNEDTVQEYAELMREHRWDFRSMQRPIVLFDGESYWLADGFHRIEAAQRAGLSDYPVEVLNGTQRDAILRAAGANSQHGLRRTRMDVQRAIELLLKDTEWQQWSNVKIAAQIGCSDKTVAEVRRKLESASEIPSLTTRQGADGKSYSISPAAPKPSAPPPATPSDAEHQAVVERILRNATSSADYQEAYSHARQASDVTMYNKLMGMVDRALEGTASEAEATDRESAVEAAEKRTPPDLIAAGVDMRRHGSWFVAIGSRGLMRGWEIRAAAPFDVIVTQARAEIARRTPPPVVTDPEPPARLPAVPPRPRRPVSADVSAQVAYTTQLEAYASALESVIQALQKRLPE